jgi:outer membrane lipoprotein carrier protein
VRSSSVRSQRSNSQRAALLLCCCALVAGAPEGDPEGVAAEALLAALQARYQAIADLRADFVQESLVASLGKRTTSSGTVAVKRPGRMRWEYREPERRVIVLDGEAIRIYSAPDEQLQIVPASAGSFSPTALSFLLGQGDLSKTFVAQRIDGQDRSELGMQLHPRADAAFELLEVWLDPETHQLRESVLVDLLGNRTLLRFSQIVENSGVDEHLFELEVPEGTEVIDLR